MQERGLYWLHHPTPDVNAPLVVEPVPPCLIKQKVSCTRRCRCFLSSVSLVLHNLLLRERKYTRIVHNSVLLLCSAPTYISHTGPAPFTLQPIRAFWGSLSSAGAADWGLETLVYPEQQNVYRDQKPVSPKFFMLIFISLKWHLFFQRDWLNISLKYQSAWYQYFQVIQLNNLLIPIWFPYHHESLVFQHETAWKNNDLDPNFTSYKYLSIYQQVSRYAHKYIEHLTLLLLPFRTARTFPVKGLIWIRAGSWRVLVARQQQLLSVNTQLTRN